MGRLLARISLHTQKDTPKRFNVPATTHSDIASAKAAARMVDSVPVTARENLRNSALENGKKFVYVILGILCLHLFLY